MARQSQNPTHRSNLPAWGHLPADRQIDSKDRKTALASIPDFLGKFPDLPQHVGNPPSLGYRLGSVAAVLKSVAVTLRCTGRRSPVHPASAVRHRW
jgi:hypothetical protein